MIPKIFKYISKNRIFLSLIGGGILFAFANPTNSSFVTAIPFILLGEFIRTWSSGYIHKNKKLAVTGPYAYTRNPLYFGSFLLTSGFALLSWNIYLIAAAVSIFFIIYLPTINAEEDKLSRIFQEEYEQYKKEVPKFFPKLFPHNQDKDKSFDWELVKKHREYNTWFGICGGIILFIFKRFIIS